VKALDPRLLRYTRATARLLAAAVLLGLLTAALAIAQAALLAHAIDAAFLQGAGLGALRPWLALLLVVFAGRALLAWAQELVAHRVSASVKSRLRRQILERAVALGPRWASEAHSGEVVALVTRGLDALDAYFARYLPQLALSAIIPPLVVVSLFLVDPLAGLTVAVTVPLIPVFMALIGRATEARKRRRWNALSRLAHQFLDVVAGLSTLKVYGRAHAQLAGLRRVTDDYRRETLATLRVAFLSAFVLELAATLSVALVAVEVGLRLVAGQMDLTRGLFVLILAPEAYLPLRQLGANYHASEEGLAAAEAAFALIETRPEGHGPGLAPPDLRGGELRVEGLTVEHADRAVAAPDGVSFTLRPGEVVALAGPSGAGKTTLLQTIVGLRVPDRGRVVVVGADGAQAPVDELDGEAWRRMVAWVPQQPFLFAGSVADNARLATPGASDAALREALRAAGLGDLDPERQLGERGLGLSSGQRRRLGVARALLRDAVLLLLDEPTAGLDAEAELAVLETVRDAARRRGMAVLLVAHRPAALAVADRVVAVASRAAA
jgi:ATP-binding cassette subfamily C protein CydCD